MKDANAYIKEFAKRHRALVEHLTYMASGLGKVDIEVKNPAHTIIKADGRVIAEVIVRIFPNG